MGSQKLVVWALATVAFGAGFVACSADDHQGGELVLANRQFVQSNYVAWHETDRKKSVHIAKASSLTRKGRSVGAIRPPVAGGSDKWPKSFGEATCGSTFISSHYAVTAAHCIDSGNVPNLYNSANSPPGSAFVIEQYDTTALNLSETVAQAYVTAGQVNNVASWDRANKLTTAEGYKVTTNTCYAYTRCDTEFGRDARCPITANSDIALVYCPNRVKSTTNWSKVATSDPGTFNIEVWWFHEVLYLATSNTNSAYQPTNNWANYGLLGTDRAVSNFHYRYDLGRHQLLPLISFLDVQDQPYKAVGHNVGAGTTATNVPACHGTSGSGAFKATAAGLADPDPQFLGPMVHGGTWADSKLCDDLFVTNNNLRMSYTAWTSTKALEGLSVVAQDRL